MIEYGLSSPVGKECKDVIITDREKKIIFNFSGADGYTVKPNIKFIIPAVNFDDARTKSEQFALPYVEKIMMVNRIRLVISPLHFILAGAKGEVERSCFVSKLWRRGASFDPDHFSQQRIDSIINTHFTNMNDKALGHFRFAMFSTTAIDQFRNLRLCLESLIPKRDVPKKRKCENCGCDLYCRDCGHQSTISGVLDEDIKNFWIHNMHGDGREIDRILKLRHKAFHASYISSIYTHDLDQINRILHIKLGFFFTQGTQFVPMEAEYGRNYYSNESFNTKYPSEEFPPDFPKEDYWREKVMSPPDDE